MDESPANKIIEDRVFEAIQSGKVRMKPRWYFTVQKLGIALAAFVALITLMFLASFMVYVLRENGVWFAPGFGAWGWYLLFASLPWVLVVISLILLAVFASLLRQYPFVYQRPLLYPLLAAVIMLLVGSVLINLTPFHREFSEYPFATNLYRGYEADTANIHRGEIVSFTMSGFVMQDFLGNTTSVALPPGAAIDVRAGDFVVVLGSRNQEGIIQASEVQKISL